jgi:DnaK suppressor protein
VAPRYSALVEERYEAELAQSAQVLDDVDRALERLSDGSYDTCAHCGAPIHSDDLRADPTRRACAQHVALDRA